MKRNDGFDYAVYLQSPEWRKRRDVAVKAAGGRCQLCYSAQFLQVHHRTYDRIGHEDSGDLTVLCARCHKKFHGITATGGKDRTAHYPSLDEMDEKVRKIITGWDLDQPITSRLVAADIGCTPARASSSLRRLWKRGEVLRASPKAYYRVGSSVMTIAPKNKRRKSSELARKNREVLIMQIRDMMLTEPQETFRPAQMAGLLGVQPAQVGMALSEMRERQWVMKCGNGWRPRVLLTTGPHTTKAA